MSDDKKIIDTEHNDKYLILIAVVLAFLFIVSGVSVPTDPHPELVLLEPWRLLLIFIALFVVVLVTSNIKTGPME